jgi:hypothetical protein
MTTVKKKKADEANAWLAVSDPRTGVKPYAERMKFHDMNAAESPRVPKGKETPSDTDIYRARETLKRAGIDVDSVAALDHCAVFQDTTLQHAAVLIGGSVARFNARNMFYETLKNLRNATDDRHNERGLANYKRIHANLKTYAAALEAAGGEKVTWPKVLPSDVEVSYT